MRSYIRSWKSVPGSCGVAAVAVVLVNQLRILTLVGLVDWLGTDSGYYWGHTLRGSLVSVLGGAAALVLFVLWLAGLYSARMAGRSRDVSAMIDPAELRRLREQAEARKLAAAQDAEPPAP